MDFVDCVCHFTGLSALCVCPLKCHYYFNFSTVRYETRKGNKTNLHETKTCRYGINSVLFRGAYYATDIIRVCFEILFSERLYHIEANVTEQTTIYFCLLVFFVFIYVDLSTLCVADHF